MQKIENAQNQEEQDCAYHDDWTGSSWPWFAGFGGRSAGAGGLRRTVDNCSGGGFREKDVGRSVVEGFGRRWDWGRDPGPFRLEGLGNLFEPPGSRNSIAHDAVERRRQCCILLAALLGERFEQKGSEVLDLESLQPLAVVTAGQFADAVAAQLDDFADREHAGGFDVTVKEAGGMQFFERAEDARCDLARLVGSHRAILEDFGEAGIGGLEHSEDERRVVEDGLAVTFYGD